MLVVLVFIYMTYTKQGYEISVVGESQATAAYAGMNVKRIVLRTMFLSGAVAGIAGMVQATGANKTLAAGVAGGVGFTAIIVAWLAQLNPWGILLVSSLFGILEKGELGGGVDLSAFQGLLRHPAGDPALLCAGSRVLHPLPVCPEAALQAGEGRDA